MFKFIKGILKPLPLDDPLYYIDRIPNIDYKTLYHYSNSVMVINPFYTTITTYTKFLNDINTLLDQNKTIPKSLIPIDTHTIPVYRFFLTNENTHHDDLTSVINDFIFASRYFITTYRLLGNSKEVHHEINKRLTTPIYENLHSVYKTLYSINT